MKKKLFFIPFAALLLYSCGSSRPAFRCGYQPDAVPGTPGGAIPQSSYPVPGRQKAVPVAVTSEERLAQRLDSVLLSADSLLERAQLGLHVVDLTTGQELFARGQRQRLRPASTEKLVTAIAALDLLGPSHTFDTRLLTTAPLHGGTLQGDLYVKGSMDPLLSTADVRALAQALKAAGVRTIAGRLLGDASMKDGDDYGWGWCWDDENPVLSPLLCGSKPGLVAQLRTALKAAGITLSKGVGTGTAPATARELAAVRRPMAQVLESMMKQSDNLCAESVFYQMGAGANSRKQIAAAIEDLISRSWQLPSPLGEAGRGLSLIADGSGLSLYNYQTPETFTHLLAYAAARPDSIFYPLLAALPIAAVDGTLKNRMADTPAAANLRAKTGSVSAVSTLAGYTTQRSTNHLIAFAIMVQGVQRMAEGRALQDQICILLSE